MNRVSMRAGGGLLAVVTALALAACNVAESRRVDLAAPEITQAIPYGPVCDSALGSYALPKAFVRLRIGQKANQAPDISIPAAGQSPVQIVRHPDPQFVYCLDHLTSATARDDIKITKAPEQGDSKISRKSAFLGTVMVNVTDQTSYIIQALLRSFFIVASGSSNFRDAVFADTEIISDVEFDPFDVADAALVNSRLTRLGFCVVLERYTLPDGTNYQQYCRNPLQFGKPHNIITRAYFTKAYVEPQAAPDESIIPGIVYRPRHPYRLMIFRKKDPAGSGDWNLQHMTNVELENLSPLLSLGISRTVFAGKNVNFVFDQGTLKTACISKTSEIEGFVDIPLQISKSLVALPGTILTVRIDQIAQQQKLVKAQEQLFLMQQAYLTAVNGGTPNVPNDVPNAAVSYPAAADPAKYTIPSDLTKQSDAPGYGQDLFARKLDDICQGKPAS
jgi:hypothetical protein